MPDKKTTPVIRIPDKSPPARPDRLRLIHRIELAGWSIGAVAAVAGVTSQAVSKWLAGETKKSVAIDRAITALLREAA